MKVQELIEKVKSNKNISLSKIIETKKYLPFAEKVELAQNIVESCTENNDGFVQINEIDQYIQFTVQTIRAYTNIEFDYNFLPDYDLLCSSGLLSDVIDTFGGEYTMVLDMVEMQKKYILSQNSIEIQVSKFLGSLSDGVDKLSIGIKNQIDSFNVNDMNISADDIRKISKFLDSLK